MALPARRDTEVKTRLILVSNRGRSSEERPEFMDEPQQHHHSQRHKRNTASFHTRSHTILLAHSKASPMPHWQAQNSDPLPSHCLFRKRQDMLSDSLRQLLTTGPQEGLVVSDIREQCDAASDCVARSVHR